MGSGGEDRDNRAVILTGSGDAFMDAIDADGFDFFMPLGYDKILRGGGKALSIILDVEVPLSTARKVGAAPLRMCAADQDGARDAYRPACRHPVQQAGARRSFGAEGRAAHGMCSSTLSASGPIWKSALLGALVSWPSRERRRLPFAAFRGRRRERNPRDKGMSSHSASLPISSPSQSRASSPHFR